MSEVDRRQLAVRCSARKAASALFDSLASAAVRLCKEANTSSG